jgi:hypothetical protein
MTFRGRKHDVLSESRMREIRQSWFDERGVETGLCPSEGNQAPSKRNWRKQRYLTGRYRATSRLYTVNCIEKKRWGPGLGMTLQIARVLSPNDLRRTSIL